MKPEITFSIIIPTYNRAGHLGKAIKSVLDQAYASFELIIVDDGSTDDTEFVVSSFKDPRIRYIKKKNGERAAARNTGTAAASGQYITFFDSDDLLYPHHLQTAAARLSDSSKEFFHLHYEILDPAGKVIRRPALLNESANKKLIEGNFLSCQGVFLRSDIAKSNLFNPDRELSGLEDWELWLRLAARYKIHYDHTITSAIINHDDRSVLSVDQQKLILRMQKFMHYVLENPLLSTCYKNDLHKFRSSCHSYVALHIALTGKNKGTAISYLLRSMKESPRSIFKRRFAAIIKHLLR